MTSTSGDDRQLLARVARSQTAEAREALAELYRRHAPAVLRFLTDLIDTSHAEDLLQDTFLVAARRAATCHGDRVRPWLLAIAANRARDVLRQVVRRTQREHEVSRSEVAGEEESVGLSTDLERALTRIAPRERAALELRFGSGLEHSEVARVLGVSLRTAKTWSTRGLERLRETLQEDA